MSSDDNSTMICFRMPDLQQRGLAVEVARNMGVTLSDWMRMIVQNALYGYDAGVVQARDLAMKMCRATLQRALDAMPTTMEEAIVTFGLVPNITPG